MNGKLYKLKVGELWSLGTLSGSLTSDSTKAATWTTIDDLRAHVRHARKVHASENAYRRRSCLPLENHPYANAIKLRAVECGIVELSESELDKI